MGATGGLGEGELPTRVSVFQNGPGFNCCWKHFTLELPDSFYILRRKLPVNFRQLSEVEDLMN